MWTPFLGAPAAVATDRACEFPSSGATVSVVDCAHVNLASKSPRAGKTNAGSCSQTQQPPTRRLKDVWWVVQVGGARGDGGAGARPLLSPIVAITQHFGGVGKTNSPLPLCIYPCAYC